MSFESLSSEFSIGFTRGADSVRFVPTLISQSATVKQGNDDANYQQNGQHSDNDHAVTALYIRVQTANLPPDLLVRKAGSSFAFLCSICFSMLNLHGAQTKWTRFESRNRIVVFCCANPVRPLMSTHLDRRVGVLVYASSVPTSIH